jgi:hypothetical protein
VVKQQEAAGPRAETKNAQTTQSLFLADLANQQRTAGDAASAILLMLALLELCDPI